MAQPDKTADGLLNITQEHEQRLIQLEAGILSIENASPKSTQGDTVRSTVDASRMVGDYYSTAGGEVPISGLLVIEGLNIRHQDEIYDVSQTASGTASIVEIEGTVSTTGSRFHVLGSATFEFNGTTTHQGAVYETVYLAIGSGASGSAEINGTQQWTSARVSSATSGYVPNPRLREVTTHAILELADLQDNRISLVAAKSATGCDVDVLHVNLSIHQIEMS